MRRITVSIVSAALLLLAGCGAPEPNLADSIEGTQYGQKVGFYIQVSHDGIAHFAFERDDLEDDPFEIYEFEFEGSHLIMKEIASFLGHGCGDAPAAIYEVHLLENGNLRFVAIEDHCRVRRNVFHGATEPIRIEVEWVPVR